MFKNIKNKYEFIIWYNINKEKNVTVMTARLFSEHLTVKCYESGNRVTASPSFISIPLSYESELYMQDV